MSKTIIRFVLAPLVSIVISFAALWFIVWDISLLDPALWIPAERLLFVFLIISLSGLISIYLEEQER